MLILKRTQFFVLKMSKGYKHRPLQSVVVCKLLTFISLSVLQWSGDDGLSKGH